MNYIITLKKAILGFLTGLAAVIIFGIVQSLTSYNPTICSDVIVTDCTPQWVASAYYMIIPTVTTFLVGIANWLKNRGK